ncbi:hypothetical protein EV426DRAFT_193045 [Tirmania nivea]|nr:hypothetical protein EV426DRAFT_193045 [Tirmania nivea]
MTLWPFRKRSKTNSGDKIEKGETRRDDDPRQTKGKQPEPRPVAIPEFPLPPENLGSTFQPQKQYHHGGFSSYFSEHAHTLSDSSDSSQLPHKVPYKPGLLRKLSKKISGHSRTESRNGQHAYITPPTSGAENSSPEMKKNKIGRSDSTKRQPKKGAFSWLGQERSTNFPPPVRDVTSSLSSSSSIRPLKPRLKGFERFVPRPKVIFGYETPALTPDPEHNQPQNTSHTRRHRLVSSEELTASGTVDGLADDLDARGLREAMERDRRRREKKKLEEQQRLERKMERRLMKQKAAEEMEFDADNEIGDSSLAGPALPRTSRTGAENLPYAPSPVSAGAQTPVSWLRDPSMEELPKTVQLPKSDEPSRKSLKHIAQEFAPQGSAQASAEGARRAKLTSFLKKATASRIRKEHANYRIRAGESALISDSEEDAHNVPPQSGISRLWRDAAQTEAQLAQIHHGEEQVGDYGDINRSGSGSSSQSSHIQGFLGYTSEPPRPIRSVVSRVTEPVMDCPTISAGITEVSRIPQASFFDAAPEGRSAISRASTQRYDSRAVSPNAPSAISTLASIDSEGSWLSGKMSRQSFSRQSGRLSRQSISRQSNSYPSPLRASSRNHDATEDETEDDEYYGKIENGHCHLSREAFEEEGEGGDMDRNEQTVLDLSEGEESDSGAVLGGERESTGRIKDGYANNPRVHNPEWRMSSRIGYLKYYDEEDEEPPSPTAATLGGYESSSPHVRPLQHPFAEEGENFVTPLEHLSETRPRYTGVV